MVVLSAPVEGRHDPGRARPGLSRPAGAPGPGHGAPGRGGRPGTRRAGDRAGPGRLRGPGGNLAHAFGARLCRIRAAAPGVVVLELVRADTLADPIGALPVTGEVDLAGLPIGRCEDGSTWRLRLAARKC